MDQNEKYIVVLYQPKDMDTLLAKVVPDNYMNRHIVYRGNISGQKRIIYSGNIESCRNFCLGYNDGAKYQSKSDK